MVDGEQRRDNFYSFVTDKVEGTRLMSLAEMLDTVEDKAGFEEMLEALDVPAAAIRNPTCIARLERREPLAGNELAFLKKITDKPVKITLPGPYLLTRSMWVTDFTSKVYDDKTEMAEDVVNMLRQELIELRDAGAVHMMVASPVEALSIAAPYSSSASRPSRSTRQILKERPRMASASHGFKTALCSIALVTTFTSLPSSAAIDRIARLLDSVPHPVKMISPVSAPMRAATCSRARSIALRTRRPAVVGLEGL